MSQGLEIQAIAPRANPDLIGHAAAEQAMLEAATTGRLPHAWLIGGPPGIGKATLAFRFARFLLAGRAEEGGGLFGTGPDSLAVARDDPVFQRTASGGHADLLTVERPFVKEDRDKEIEPEQKRRQREIPVDEIRRIGPFLRLTPAEGGFRIVVVDEAERMNAEVYAALSTHGRYRGEAEGRRTDGSVFPMELSINQLDDSNTVAVVRDLTELKAAEAERAILREQRFRSQKLEAIGRLAGGIAHDFNNILAAIIGYADFLMEDLPRGSESRTFAGNIHTAGHRAKRLVTQILTFSRQHDCRPVRTDLGNVLEETATMLRATLPSTALLDLDLPEEPVFAQVDAGQIGQVVMNLCVNARDALGERQGQIAVRLEPVTAADAGAAEGPPNLTGSWNAVQVDPIRELGAVRIEATDRGGAVLRVGQVAPGTPVARITVTDTGCGIERATLERLFDPFFTTKPIPRAPASASSSWRLTRERRSSASTTVRWAAKGVKRDPDSPAERSPSSSSRSSSTLRLNGRARASIPSSRSRTRASSWSRRSPPSSRRRSLASVSSCTRERRS